MNLNGHPTRQQLAEIFRSAIDDAGPHCLWVDNEGDVHLTHIPSGTSSDRFLETCADSMRFRLQTLNPGMGYVGEKAAVDEEWMDAVYSDLLAKWNAGYRGCIL